MLATATDLGLTAGAWNIDPVHSEVTFTIRHMMTKVRGSFTDFTGTVRIADDVLASTASVEIKMASIDTRHAGRDADVRSAGVLDVENHPTMTFTSSGIRAEGGNHLLDGELTIKGTARPVTLNLEFHGVAEDPWGATRAGFSASTTINRRDWGITFNIPLPGEKPLLGDKVDIQLEVQAVRA